jgi:hypothetical protein
MNRDIAARIERAYRLLEQKKHAHGARAWFARRAYSHPTTVSRWIAAGELDGAARGLLETLEELADERVRQDETAAPD